MTIDLVYANDPQEQGLQMKALRDFLHSVELDPGNEDQLRMGE